MTCRAVFVAAMLTLAGCNRAPSPHGAVALVERAVDSCTAATAALGPHLKAGDRIGALQAALYARNTCSTARETIARAVGDRLPDCRAAVDLQTRTQSRELKALDGDMPPAAVVAMLDRAIVAQQACAVAVKQADGSTG